MDNNMAANVAQLKRSNNKCYTLAFRYIYIYIYSSHCYTNIHKRFLNFVLNILREALILHNME